MSEPVEVKTGTPKIDSVLEYARRHAMGEADLLALSAAVLEDLGAP
jgi:hypothetical protein